MTSPYIVLKLNEHDKEKVLDHFLNLDKESVYTRFCAPLKDDNITQYVNKLNFEEQGIFGIFNEDLKLIGIGECFLTENKGKKKAELAFSVMKEHQGKGLGNMLVQKLISFASIEQAQEIEMYHLSANSKVTKLAKKVGMTTTNEYGESHSHVNLELNEKEKLDILLQYNLEETLGTMSLYQRKNMIDIVKNNQQFVNFLNMNFISQFLDIHEKIQKLNENVVEEQKKYFDKQQQLVQDFQKTIQFFEINPSVMLEKFLKQNKSTPKLR